MKGKASKVACPVCGALVIDGMISLHLDGKNGCLERQKNRTSVDATQDRAPTAKKGPWLTAVRPALSSTHPKKRPLPTCSRIVSSICRGSGSAKTKAARTETVDCPCCGQAVQRDIFSLHFEGKNGCLARQTCKDSKGDADADVEAACPWALISGPVPGLFLVPNFITEDEADDIVSRLDADKTSPWHFSSFNGNCMSKTYGYRTQFGKPGEERCVRLNDVSAGEQDMPPFLTALLRRMQQVVAAFPSELGEMVNKVGDINECNANSYESDDHYLRPHFDDRHMSGPFLCNLSMCRSAYMTYSRDTGAERHTEDVLLKPLSLQLVTKEARWMWQHEMRQGAFLPDGDRRVSVTWRCVGAKGQFASKRDASMDSFVTKAIAKTEVGV